MIDETDSHGVKPRVFLMGGYIATVEQWEQLTDAWNDELNRPPKLDYFSFREAFPTSGKPNGQFYNMNAQQRDERLANFREIIEQFTQYEIMIGFQLRFYQNAFSFNKRMRNNHYMFALPNLQLVVSQNLDRIELTRQPIEFIFDSRKIEEPKIIEAWAYARDHAETDPPDIFQNILTTLPQFRSSRDVIALQTADMLVGWTRACNVGVLNNRPAPLLPGMKRRIKGLFLTFDDEQLNTFAETARLRLLRQP